MSLYLFVTLYFNFIYLTFTYHNVTVLQLGLFISQFCQSDNSDFIYNCDYISVLTLYAIKLALYVTVFSSSQMSLYAQNLLYILQL